MAVSLRLLYGTALNAFLLLVLVLRTSTADKALWYKCSDANGNYTANSTYEANLNLLLSSLSSNSHVLTGFYNASFGSVPNRVYGLALCQGDVDTSDCHNCLIPASSDAPQLCPYSKAVNIWFSKCHIRYSNEQILSSMDSSVAMILYNVKTIDASEFDRFNRSVVTLLNELANYAVYNSTKPPLFAAGEIVYRSTEYPKLYGLVQCTRNIAAADCYRCLQDLIGAYLRCCPK